MHTSTPFSSKSEVFQFGEFTFDCGSHLLHRNGEEQRLSPKARQLLRMLLLNRPKAVAREEIYDALWPSTFVSETNMASIVSELRRALGDDARSAQYIRTVHGFGYAFAADPEPGDAKPIVAGMLLCEGQRHTLYGGANVIGRSQECDIVLSGPTVSRRHAIITIAGNTISIEDIGSRNGTYINAERVTRAEIQRGDAITFGAVPAAISRKVSSTLPMVLQFPTARPQSSDKIVPAR